VSKSQKAGAHGRASALTIGSRREPGPFIRATFYDLYFDTVSVLKFDIMKIGIIVAMDKELGLLLPHIDGCSHLTVNGMDFYSGTMGERHVVVMKCGIGKVNAAVGALTMIENFHPRMIINTGVAGGTGTTRVLDVVIASEVAYYDVWCGPGTVEGQAAGCPPRFVSAVTDDMVRQMGLSANVRRGLVASGDIFVSRPEDIKKILDMYPDAVAVDMESGAIAQVCHLKGVPFVCIRVVSDTPGGADNIAQYENFWEDAPRETFEILNVMMSKL